MLAFLLFAVAFAEKVYVKEITEGEDAGLFFKGIPGDCNYVHGKGSFILKEGKVFQCYKSKDCSGSAYTADKEPVCAEINDIIGENYGSLESFVENPKHLGFKNLPEDANCPNEEYSMRKYVHDGCVKVGEQSFKFTEENGKMMRQKYSDAACSKADGTKTEFFQCNTCKDGVKYVCGAFSTMILAIFLVLAFLF